MKLTKIGLRLATKVACKMPDEPPDWLNAWNFARFQFSVPSP